MRRALGARIILSLIALASLAETARSVIADEENPYTIENGKVDFNTYNGWRRYTDSCLRCHGPDGAGSSYAPDLTQSLKSMSEEQFNEVVVNGRQNVNAASKSIMPPFGMAEDVMLYIDDIYAYLKARSDGAVGRGRPDHMDKKPD